MALKDKLMERAQNFLQKGYLDKAIVEYKAAYDADPKDISIRLRIGDLYVKMGMKVEAVAEYKEVAKTNAQRGFYLKSIAVYKQVLKLEETNYEVHYKLAELYAKQRLVSDAISEYSFLASNFERKGKTGEVMQLLKEMLDIDQENIGVRLKLADIYQKLNFEKDALNEYSIIFKKYVAQDKLDKAEKIYATLHGTYPKDIHIVKGLAELYKKRRDDARCLKFSRELLKICVERSDAEGIKHVAESILELDPNDADSLKALGRGKKEAKTAAPKAKGPEPLIGFSEKDAWRPAHALEPEPLISFPDFGEAQKPPEAPGFAVQPEAVTPPPLQPEEPLISFPLEGVGLDGLEMNPKEGPHPELMPEEAVEEAPHEAPAMEFEFEVEAGPPEDGAPAEPEAGMELPGKAQSEIDAIFGAAAGTEAPSDAAPAIEFEFEAPAETVEEVKEEPVEEPETEIKEEFIFEEVHLELSEVEPHVESEAARLVTHDDLTKAITELTEHHEPLEMVEEEPSIEAMPPGEEAPAEPQGEWKGEDFVDLSKELGMEEALSDLAGSWSGAAGGGAKETYDEFKTGIGNQLNKEDSETHFNLGIAYMEMELMGEAVKEFKIALKDPRLEFDCYTRLALCAMAERNPDEAIVYYTKGLRVAGRSDEERKGMMYELALAYEAAEKVEEAGKLFTAIYAVDPGYRETEKKMRKIAESIYRIPLEDGMLEVELM
ncbi:MAG: tetratricopeptide repeat protein [Deltaproteobacteria bacterium]|nr:tetratricopeptide repeat protein [Deltaproteobacteria bacterium]